jgi:DNA-binding response OmpR family regulator
MEAAAEFLSLRSIPVRDVARRVGYRPDDFIPQPVRYLELRARLQVLLRRSGKHQQVKFLQVGPLTIDTAARVASLHGEHLEPRRMEYDLLLHLASDPSECFSDESC